MLHHVRKEEEISVSTYLMSLGQYCLLASHVRASQYWQLLVSESERTFNLS